PGRHHPHHRDRHRGRHPRRLHRTDARRRADHEGVQLPDPRARRDRRADPAVRLSPARRPHHLEARAGPAHSATLPALRGAGWRWIAAVGALLALPLTCALVLRAASAAPAPDAVEFTVLSYNTHGLPGWIAGDAPERRFPLIGALAQRYDVALF